MHNMPGLPVGKFFFQPGALWRQWISSILRFVVVADTVRSAQSHRSSAGCRTYHHRITKIVSRNVDPLEAAVITVGSIVRVRRLTSFLTVLR